MNNPLLLPWTAPHALPPFSQVRPEHFASAFAHAMREQLAELDAIAADPAPASFDNTVAAFDRSGRLLARLEGLFHNLCASATSPALQEVQRDLAQPLAAHASAVQMHAGVFSRLEQLHEQRHALGLDGEQRRLLERVHQAFVRSGARLEPAAQARYAQLMQRLAALNTRFAQNVLADEAAFRLPLRGESELAGLPAFVRAAAAHAARERGLDGHVITLSRSLIVPFLAFSERRDLRERAWRAWVARGEREGDTDNRAIVREILALRTEQARAHGCACYADYALEDTMAGEQGEVRRLLDDVWQRALAAFERELDEIDDVRRKHGDTGTLQAWDWRYWAQKVRQEHYAVDDAQAKPYFALDRMVAAAFDCARRLFGITFVERADLPVYHPDVKAYEVHDGQGRPVGVFLHDNFARLDKRSGAWMSAFRWQSKIDHDVLPVIVNNNNFAKAAPGEPVLLGLDDVRTLFHEFGHGLHGLLSNVRYERLSGTNVLRDFVELPSQLYEHWAEEREVLERHARHAVTGEPIPPALVQRLQAARRFGQGYETVRYCASALVDLEVHALPQAPDDIVAFEAATLARLGLPAAAGLNHRLPHFQHLFSSDAYAAGYYVYLWAEVLDCDAFEAFAEAGSAFDAATAQRLHRCIYAAGDSIEPGEAFVAFRGRPPVVEPMLRERGLV